MSWFIAKVLSPILVLGILVLVHEFGHFIVAKWCRVGVLKFAVGFGPAICRFTRGETVYQIGLIPLGGFVRMVGDMPDAITGPQVTDQEVRAQDGERTDAHMSIYPEDISPEGRALINDRSRWFVEKNLWQRSAIVFAGPLFNFIWAIIVTFICVAIYGERIPDESPRIGNVAVGSPAERSGVHIGDLVKSVDGKAIQNWQELSTTIRGGTGKPLHLVVEREGQSIEIDAQPETRAMGGDGKPVYVLGITSSLDAFQHRDAGLAEAAKFSVLFTVENSLMTYYGIWSMIRGHISTDELAGPIYIVKEAGHRAQKGMEDVLYLMALLSVSLAVLNLLPIPILDGGHLMFFFTEAIIGPISIRKKEFAQHVGLILLLSLMVFAIRNDIVRKAPQETPAPKKWENFGDVIKP